MLCATHPAYLAKVMSAQLNARFDKKGEKAAMLIVSSAGSFMPSPGNLIYSAAKIFTSYIGEGLYYEFEGKVDVLNYMPASVETNMFNSEKAGSSAGFISAEEAVEVSLRDLGVEPSSYGHHSHENTIGFISMFPRPMMARASFNGTNEHFARLEKEAAEKAAAGGATAGEQLK